MNVNEHQILELIRQGEGIATEFKTCRNQLNRDVYKTVCAFLNRHGGTILLGVQDSGEVQGIDPDSVAQVKKDFVTAVNNPQKIHPPAYLSVNIAEMEGKTILRIYVPESSQVHRCNGRIYDRNEDGDFDITDHTRLVAELYHRKQATYSENKIYPYAGLVGLRADLIAKCRRLAGVWRDDHPWLRMDDMDLLKSAQLYQTDPETGKSGVTLAGILLLGNDRLILTAVPHHRTDLILRKINLDRYDDRDLVTTNLIESYERIMAFVQKHLPDPFYLEGIERISIRDAIFREVTSNILIHREYRNAFPAKLIIERGQVRTENSNKPHGFGVLDPATFTPFPKNPVIGAFFREIGRADELGSGMRKMMKYGKAYSGADPEMIEGDVFRIIVKVPEFQQFAGSERQTGQLAPEVTPEVKKMLSIMHAEMARSEIMSKLGLADEKHFREHYQQIGIKLGLIEMTIPDKPKSNKQKYRLTEKGRLILRA
ncbi:MAG: putative DNA binding domain-containing protein [Desulfobulbaceae bacterium]|nr:putative DNA binding domain-containing protein [Desulfobulbaceae bacterium]